MVHFSFNLVEILKLNIWRRPGTTIKNLRIQWCEPSKVFFKEIQLKSFHNFHQQSPIKYNQIPSIEVINPIINNPIQLKSFHNSINNYSFFRGKFSLLSTGKLALQPRRTFARDLRATASGAAGFGQPQTPRGRYWKKIPKWKKQRLYGWFVDDYGWFMDDYGWFMVWDSNLSIPKCNKYCVCAKKLNQPMSFLGVFFTAESTEVSICSSRSWGAQLDVRFDGLEFFPWFSGKLTRVSVSWQFLYIFL